MVDIGFFKFLVLFYSAVVILHPLLKEYRMVFHAGLCDPCMRDVARLSESVKILKQFVKSAS